MEGIDADESPRHEIAVRDGMRVDFLFITGTHNKAAEYDEKFDSHRTPGIEDAMAVRANRVMA